MNENPFATREVQQDKPAGAVSVSKTSTPLDVRELVAELKRRKMLFDDAMRWYATEDVPIDSCTDVELNPFPDDGDLVDYVLENFAAIVAVMELATAFQKGDVPGFAVFAERYIESRQELAQATAMLRVHKRTSERLAIRVEETEGQRDRLLKAWRAFHFRYEIETVPDWTKRPEFKPLLDALGSARLPDETECSCSYLPDGAGCPGPCPERLDESPENPGGDPVETSP